MSKQKYYAVRVGRIVGVFDNWPDCQKQTSGYSGSEYKSFYTKKEAEDYIAAKSESNTEKDLYKDSIIGYIDQRYNKELGICTYGIIVVHDGKNRIEYGKLNFEKNGMEEVCCCIQSTIKAMEIAQEYNNEGKKVIVYNGNTSMLEESFNSTDEIITSLLPRFKSIREVIEVEFREYDDYSLNKYEEVKLLTQYAEKDDLISIVKNIQYHECYSHDIKDFTTMRGLNISTKNYIDNIKSICSDIGITVGLKDDIDVNNDKHIIIYFSKNYLNSEIHLHISKDGLTVDVNRAKCHELNYLIIKEYAYRYEISYVEEKKYSYKGLDDKKISSVIENLTLFNDSKEYEFKSNTLAKNMKYSCTIKSNISSEKVHLYVYTNNTLEIRGVKYLLWEDICYIVEKSIGVTLNDIIGRMNVGIDLNFEVDNLDYLDEGLKNELGIELADFLYSYDYDVILSVKCSFDAKIKISDYGIYIDPLTKAIEGYLKKILLHLKIVESQMEMNKSTWRFDSVFDYNCELKSHLHNKLNCDNMIRHNQLSVLSELCNLMWSLRNKINHSGPKGTIAYNDYKQGINKYNEIIDLLKKSFVILVK